MPDSALHRKLRGPMAAWDVNALIMRQVLHAIQGGNWQRGGGKGSKPKPIPLPDDKGRGDSPPKAKSSGEETARRLQAMGMIPPGTVT